MGHQAASRDGTPVAASTNVIQTVARREGTDPLELPSLFRTIDTDALDALVENSHGSLEVVFDYEGYSITVRGDGRVDVET